MYTIKISKWLYSFFICCNVTIGIKNIVFSIRIKLHFLIEKTLYLDTTTEKHFVEIRLRSNNVHDNSNHFPPLYLRISFARQDDNECSLKQEQLCLATNHDSHTKGRIEMI